MRNVSDGVIWIQRPPLPTRSGHGTVNGFRCSDCCTRPADASSVTNGFALPSSAGISGPSTSMSRLSTPSPMAAAMRCSTVWTRVPFTPSVVA